MIDMLTLDYSVFEWIENKRLFKANFADLKKVGMEHILPSFFIRGKTHTVQFNFLHHQWSRTRVYNSNDENANGVTVHIMFPHEI